MNLDAGLFLYSHYSISGIQYRKGRCVIFSSKIECRFYDWSLVFYAIYTYYNTLNLSLKCSYTKRNKVLLVAPVSIIKHTLSSDKIKGKPVFDRPYAIGNSMS